MRIRKERYKAMVAEIERLRGMLRPLPEWITGFVPTQEQAELLFDLLIGKSWESPECFEICQSAWDIVSMVYKLHTEIYKDANQGQMERLNGDAAEPLRRVWRCKL
jgi:hypothetical protein